MFILNYRNGEEILLVKDYVDSGHEIFTSTILTVIKPYYTQRDKNPKYSEIITGGMEYNVGRTPMVTITKAGKLAKVLYDKESQI